MLKHAYLIMAHDNFRNLSVLLELLDDSRNDIYLHIDQRCSNWNPDEWKNLLQNANLYFVQRVKVYWGTYSQINAVMSLMKEATSTYHDYYHILSGSDLPIKTQEEIDTFFIQHKGMEFVGFAPSYNKEVIHQINFFTNYMRSKNKYVALIAKKIRKELISIQKLFKVDVMKKFDMEIKKGTDWYSITHEATLLLLENEPHFKKYFQHGLHVGEFFAQTILHNSPLKKNIYFRKDENIGSQRYIDWKNTANNNFVFTCENYNALVESELMFARKFHENIDLKVIKMIQKKLTQQEG